MPRLPSRNATSLVPALVVAAVVAAGCSGGTGKITKADVPATTTGRAERTTTTVAVESAGAGAAGIGDPTIPGAGNGGYDVSNYSLEFNVADGRGSISATATITATATQDLSSFNLDLSGLQVESVTVDHLRAANSRAGDELTVTPPRPIASGAEFVTVVDYSGSPQPVADPTAPGTIGWLSAPSGTFVAAETTGAKGFFPCNDHPADKATFTIAVTAASTETVIANGRLVSTTPAGADHSTWTFTQPDPMATYLVQIAVGEYELIESTGPHGLPIRHAVVAGVTPEQRAVLDDTADQIAYFESLFGPYPFETYGLLVADSAPEFALETQTLTLLPAAWLRDYDRASASAVMAHELAHQWYGDSVTPARWADIWLNEGFATYAEWLWEDHVGSTPLAESVSSTMDQAGRWREAFGAVAAPRPEFLFSPNSYGGSGIVLHALRLTVGDDAFFEILRTWAAEREGTSATTEQFEALASELGGQDLTGFFDAWLRSSTLPPLPA